MYIQDSPGPNDPSSPQPAYTIVESTKSSIHENKTWISDMPYTCIPISIATYQCEKNIDQFPPSLSEYVF